MEIVKRLLVGLFLIFFSLALQAQPLTYYQNAWGKKGGILRSELNDIISVHTKLPYTSSNTDTWDVLKVSDRDTANVSNVLLIYAGVSVDGPQEYNSGNGWTREHVWPRSLGGFTTSIGPGTDVHNLKPADGGLNSLRSNYEYDDLGTGGSAVNYNGSATGNRYDGPQGLFEPRDAVKGDLARIILYMDLRYEGEGSEPNLSVTNSLNNGGLTFAVKSTLLQWHFQDTVDAFERRRNDVIDSMQGNRNPFIDHPELVHYLYGDSTNVSWYPVMEDGIIICGVEEKLMVFPNPVDTELVIRAPFAGEVVFTSSATKSVFKEEHDWGETRIDVSRWPAGMYVARFDNGEQLQVIVTH